ncbi:MAG: hypothetical protein ABI183_10360 [Polyangiaceae bacterium]
MLFLALVVAAEKKFHFMPKLKSAGRVVGYTVVVGGALGAFSIHKARAAFEEESLGLGADLMSIAPLLEDAHAFSFNGQQAHVSATKTTDSLGRTLDMLEQNCRENGGNNVETWKVIPTPAEMQKRKTQIQEVPILRHETGKTGVVICFVKSKQRDESASIQERMKAFADTGDIGMIGKVRYAYASSNKNGTSVITVWTDDSFNVFALQPKDDGDTLGKDPVKLPRPADSNRFMTVEADARAGLESFGYASHKSVKDAAAAYDEDMTKAGWKIIVPRAAKDQAANGRIMRAYLHDGFIGYALFSPLKNGQTIIALSEGGKGAPAPDVDEDKGSDGF